jgi:hypothetical protein
LKKNIIELIWVYNSSHEFDELIHANINWSNIFSSQYLLKRCYVQKNFKEESFVLIIQVDVLDFLFLLFITVFFFEPVTSEFIVSQFT